MENMLLEMLPVRAGCFGETQQRGVNKERDGKVSGAAGRLRHHVVREEKSGSRVCN